MICSACGEKIEKGSEYFEFYESKEFGGNEQVILCVDCLNENLYECDEE